MNRPVVTKNHTKDQKPSYNLKSKLGITPKMTRFLIINPPSNFLSRFGPVGPEVQFIGFDESGADMAIVFLIRKSELTELLPLLKYKVKRSGYIWIGYPNPNSQIDSNIDLEFIQKVAQYHDLSEIGQATYDSRWNLVKFILS